jgi:dihydroorotase
VEEIIKPLLVAFPSLKMTMEHISTREAAAFFLASVDNLKVRITCHHLICNQNCKHHVWWNEKAIEEDNAGEEMSHSPVHPFSGKRPPTVVLLAHSQGQSALSSCPRCGSYQCWESQVLFGDQFGTPSHPHGTKESACTCAGVCLAHVCVEIYASLWERGKLDNLEDFCSLFGANHHGIPRNTATMTFEKTPWTLPKTHEFGEDTATPLRSEEEAP